MEQFIYFIQAGKSGPIKIGITQNVLTRLSTLQTSHYEKLNLLKLFRGKLDDETNLLKQFKNCNIRGEWFWPTEEIISYIDILPSDMAYDYNTVVDGKCLCGNIILHVKLEKNKFLGYCHACLMEKDGRLAKLILNAKNQPIQDDRPCKICSKKERYLRRGRCAACAAYFRRIGQDRPKSLINRRKTCINCDRLQKQLIRNFCSRCYYRWKQDRLNFAV